jgi:type IV pilus assembly protein PilC
MDLYTYTATTIGGRRARGQRIAESPGQLQSALQSEGLRDVAVQAPRWWNQSFGRRVSGRDLALFTQRFSMMTTTTGSPALALRKLVALARSAALRRALSEVTREVQEGSSIADAMRKHPTVFNTVYTNGVEAGEQSGRLPEMLGKLAARLSAMDELRGKLVSAMVYPLGVLFFALVATWYMLAKVIPTFAKILTESGMALPASTRAIIWASSLVQTQSPLIAGLGAAGMLAGIMAMRNPRVQEVTTLILQKVPAVGTTLTAAAMANFCGMFALMYGSGMPLVQSLRLAAETIPTAGIRRRVSAASAEVAEGGTLAGALERTEAVPPEVSDAAAAGEQSGRLAEQLEQSAVFYERDLADASRRLSAFAEIALIGLVAVGISILVISVYRPLFESTRAMATRHG